MSKKDQNKFEFVVAGGLLYNFIWDDFCSTYVEMCKIVLNGDDEQAKASTKQVMYYVLEAILTMIHPFIPFVTEEIYQSLKGDDQACLMLDGKWPEVKEEYNLSSNVTTSINDIIKTVRNVKNDNNIAPSKKIALHLVVTNAQLKGMSIALTDILLFLPMSGIINKDEEIARLTKELERLEKEIARSEGMLNNPSFVSKAPEAKVALEKQKLEDNKAKKETVIKSLEEYK